MMNDRNRSVIEGFRANGGKVGGPWKDMQLLLLHTTGARTGRELVNPVATMQDGERLIIIASKGGAPTHPHWYHNLVANPKVRVEVGTEELEAETKVLSEPERTEVYARMAGLYPGFAEYQRRTERVIPVIALTPYEA